MAAQRPIRFGILGAARIAPDALIKAAHNVPEAEVVAVAARDPKRAREFAATHKIPRVLATYDDLVKDPELDVIYNPLPNSLHCEWTIAALRAGKHVLCEKPLSSNAAEAERMSKAADESGKILGEAFHYRYHPLADRVRALISDGTLGRLVRVEGNFSVPIPETNIRFDWSLAGGATMDLGCYPLHMIRYFSGLTPRVISAKAETGPKNIDIAMEVDLELADGVTARMTCAMKKDSVISASFIGARRAGRTARDKSDRAASRASAHGEDGGRRKERDGAGRHDLHPSTARVRQSRARRSEISHRRRRGRRQYACDR